MIDTHTHLNFQAFKDDWREVAERAISEGVEKMMVVGTDIETSRRAVEMAAQHPALYAAVGIHPHHAKQLITQNLKLKTETIEEKLVQLEQLIQQPRVVAVGEIGLDQHVYRESKRYEKEKELEIEKESGSISQELVEIQRQLFLAQLELAHKYKKPVIVHSRKVGREALETLIAFNQTSTASLNGVFHCFEGSKQFAKEILEAGFHLSFTGNLTYEQGKGEVAKVVPLNKLLLETDCPFMTPEPERSQKREILKLVQDDGAGKVLRSEPRHVKIIGQCHATLRGLSEDEVFRQTTLNAQGLFCL